MDRNSSTKLSGFIAKLTVAANKAIDKTHDLKKSQKQFTTTDFHLAIPPQQFEQKIQVGKWF